MRLDATAANVGSHHGLPLCRRYQSLHVTGLPVPVKRGKGRGELLRWAMGVLQNGELELSGVWTSSLRRDASRTADEIRLMQSRGVEAIGLLVIHRSSSTWDCAEHSVDRLAAVPPEERLYSSFTDLYLQHGDLLAASTRRAGKITRLSSGIELQSHSWRSVLRGSQAVFMWRSRLQRAFARHGEFKSDSEAVAFAEAVLPISDSSRSRRHRNRVPDTGAQCRSVALTESS